MNNIAARIVSLRMGMPRRAFAQKLGITESTLRNYEKGISLPDAQLLADICQKMQILPKWLLLGEGPMTDSGTLTGKIEHPIRATSDESPSSKECPRCTKLEAKLDLAEEERRETYAENKQLHKDKESLLRENAELREKLARLEATTHRDISPEGVLSIGADSVGRHTSFENLDTGCRTAVITQK